MITSENKVARLFILSLMIPSVASIEVLGLRLSFYRIVLLISFFNILLAYRNIKKHKIDSLVFMLSVWIFFSMIINHGESGVISGGIISMETLVPYLLARVYVKKINDLKVFIQYYICCIWFILIVSVPENFDGIPLFKRLFNIGEISDADHKRIGLYRAFGVFDHPILSSVFCALGFSLVNIVGSKEKIQKIVVALATFTGLSSVGFLLIGFQLFLILYKKILSLKKILLFLFLVYILIDLVSTRNPLDVVISYLTLDPQTGFFRKMIWEYGIKNIVSNPLFGIGFKDWIRPSFMPPSVDSFWLLMTMRHGIPAFIFLCLIFVESFQAGARYEFEIYEKYLIIAIYSIAFAGLTVHFWNALYVFVFFLIGLKTNVKYYSLYY